MDPYQHLLKHIEWMEKKIGYVFQNKELLTLAFVHRSFYNEQKDQVLEHNERLEFLGDSVLSILTSEYLYSSFPSLSEGELSHMRSHLVDAAMCARLLQKLDFAEFILLGRGEKRSEGKNKESIQADLFEALLGALFLDGGFFVAKTFFWDHFKEEVESSLQRPIRNWKAELQDYSQKKHQKIPVYQVLTAQGPDHNKEFEVAVYVEDQEKGRGRGGSKKEAEQQAAERALLSLEKTLNLKK
jgi:ribonuclease-3